MHPLVKLILDFIRSSQMYLKEEEKLIETLFGFMIDNVTESNIKDELGKAVMRWLNVLVSACPVLSSGCSGLPRRAAAAVGKFDR